MSVSETRELADKIRTEVAKAITGQTDTVDMLLTALFAGGHILLEGPPGVAKTLTARVFAQVVGVGYGRIQFTPDLMPGDVIGSNIYNFQSGQFTLTRGPIFCDLLLADEINRTPPKTQAALLEAMQERAVTFDGETHRLSDVFMVVATQNPLEHQGVYPLPEAQLDRFLFKHIVSYPDEVEELKIIQKHGALTGSEKLEQYDFKPQADEKTILKAMESVAAVRLVDDVVSYISRLIRETRVTADFAVGASPRAGAMMARAARSRAALEGRDYVIPDDVKSLALPALRHRVVLSPAAQIDGRTAEEILTELVERTEVPR